MVNKFELMNIFNDVFEKKLKINKVNKPEEKVDRSLISNYNELEKLFGKSDIQKALYELTSYMKKNNF